MKTFPERLHQDLENEVWIINPFIADHLKEANLGKLMKILINLQQNFSEIASFKTLLHYEYYSVGLLESPEYKIALKILQQLVLMPTT